MDNRKNIFDMSKNLPLLPRIVTDVSELWRVIYGSQRVVYGCLRLTTSWRSLRNRKKYPCMWTRYYAQRKCQICDIEIEDEFHFMFVCPLYNADRTKLLPRYYRINPSMQKFINLMNETNARLTNRVAKFVYKSFKTRTAYFSQHWNSYLYVVISTDDFVSVSVAWIFPETPLKANGVPGSVRGSTPALRIVCWGILHSLLHYKWHENSELSCVTFAVFVTCWCHCNYVHLFSCTGLWPYEVWNKTYLLTNIFCIIGYKNPSPSRQLLDRIKCTVQRSHELTHWGRVTHICVGYLTIIGSDNVLSPGRRQAIIWTNAGILLIGTLGTNVSEILAEIITFSFKKMYLKVSSAKRRPFCLGLNVLKESNGEISRLQRIKVTITWWRVSVINSTHRGRVTHISIHKQDRHRFR